MPVRRTARRALIAGLAACIAVPLLQAAAAAALTCSFDPGTAAVTVSVSSGEPNFGTARVRTREDGAIVFGGNQGALSPCGSATVTNTDRITVTGAEGRQQVEIGMFGGPFQPGLTPESDADEIEITVNLLGGTDDSLSLVGSPQGDLIRLGVNSVGLPRATFTSDADHDLNFTSVERISVSGSGGPDVLTGQGGSGTGSAFDLPIFLMTGGTEADLITGGTSEDHLNGNEGNDTVDGAQGNDQVVGQDGTDVMIGGAGNDLLNDFSSDSGLSNRYVPGPDNDTVTGRASQPDLVDYSGSAASVTANLTNGTATGEGTDTLISIDNVTGSAFDDTLTGTDGRNLIRGGGGGDLIQAQRDSDGILPGPGNDDVRAGAGIDTVSYADSPVAVEAHLARGIAEDQGTDTLAANIENLVGSRFADTLTGTDGPNFIFGLDGNDDLFGLGNDDTMFGGLGFDDFDGGPGTDTCVQEAGGGVITECENVGTFELKPARAEVSAGEPLDYLLTWTHPNRWRRLDTVELRVRDGDRILAWVRWNQEGNTFQLFDPGTGRFGPAAPGRDRGTLGSPFAVLHLRGSDQVAFDTETIGVLMRLSFRPAAAGEHVVEVTAEDDRNNRNAWEPAGTLKVSG